MPSMSFTHGLSPFSVITEYAARADSGFITTPTSDTARSGWGEPFADPEGNDISPGTAGGPSVHKLLSKTGAASWGRRNTPGNQLFGNISWLGKLKKEDVPRKGKWVLTYHGPVGRHFGSADFSYGSEATHNNIYCGGKCIAVAKGPVLGAAMRVSEGVTAKGDAYKKFEIVCICAGDKAYIKEVNPFRGATEATYTSAFRSAEMLTYEATEAPTGWRFLGQMDCTTGSTQGLSREIDGPTTPWFFDETGTIAQCMRTASITFKRCADEAETVTQDGYVRFKATVTGESITGTCMDNTTGLLYTIRHKVERLDDYRNVTKWPWDTGPEIPHSWRTHKISTAIEGSGTYDVAVDYRGTKEMLLSATLRANHLLTQYVYKGNDAEVYPEYFDEYFDHLEYLNTDSFAGDIYKASLPETIPAEEDGCSFYWSNVDSSVYLNAKDGPFIILNRAVNGSKTRFLTGEDDPDDPYEYFTYESRNYPHYVNISRPHFMVYGEVDLYQLGTLYREETEFCGGGGSGAALPVQGIMSRDHEAEPPETIPGGTPRAWDINTQLEAHWLGGVNKVRLFKSYDGLYPSDFDVPETEPDPLDFFRGGYKPLLAEKAKSIKESLTDAEKSVREMGIAEDSHGNIIASMKYLDADKKVKYYNAVNRQEILDGLTKATGANIHYYPLGEV